MPGPHLSRRTFNEGLLATAIIAGSTWKSAAAQADPLSQPRLSQLTQAVDDGGSFVAVGDNLGEGTEILLYRPPVDAADAIRAGFTGSVEPIGAPPSSAKATTILGTPQINSVIAGQIGYPTLARNVRMIPTMVWARRGGVVSNGLLLNRAELFWTELPTALPGEVMRFFGRNLETESEITGARYDYPVALTHRATKRTYWGQTLKVESQGRAFIAPFVLHAKLPADLPNGTYDVRVHTLYGGQAGWSDPVALEVVRQRDLAWQVARAERSNVSGVTAVVRKATVTGIDTTGIRDESNRVQRAIDALASAGGGVLTLPPGSIAIGNTLRLPRGVVLQGSGRAATRLTEPLYGRLAGGLPIDNMFTSPSWMNGFVGDYKQYISNRTPLLWIQDSAGVQDLAIHTSAADVIGILVGSNDPGKQIRFPSIKRVAVRSWNNSYGALGRFTPATTGVLVLSGTFGFTLVDSDLHTHEPLTMYGARFPHEYAYVAGNRFESDPHNDSNLGFVNAWKHSVFEDNRLTNGAELVN